MAINLIKNSDTAAMNVQFKMSIVARPETDDKTFMDLVRAVMLYEAQITFQQWPDSDEIWITLEGPKSSVEMLAKWFD